MAYRTEFYEQINYNLSLAESYVKTSGRCNLKHMLIKLQKIDKVVKKEYNLTDVGKYLKPE